MSAAARIRILLLIPHTLTGGAERVIMLLSQHLNHSKFEIHLGLIARKNIDTIHISPHIHIHSIQVSRVRNAALPLLRLVRSIQPDILLSGIAHLNFLVLLLGTFLPAHTRILIRQNGSTSTSLDSSSASLITHTLYRLLYPRANKIICQSNAMTAELQQKFHISPSQTVVLSNPIEIRPEPALSLWPSSGPNLLAVGRLVREKGFDLLLHAFATLRRSHPTANLTIAGTGPCKAELESLSQQLNLTTLVHFAGHIHNPAIFYPGATLYALSSHHEGMPNALLEAAFAGLPIVTTPASAGLTELLHDHPGIWITKEISASALVLTLHTAITSLLPCQRFLHTFLESFRLQNAISAYESFFEAVHNGAV